MPTITILGTGTGIGKTFVSCAVARALASARPNTPVLALKPIESGTSAIPGPDSDAALLAAASHPPFPAPAQPYAFAEALSPHLAARRSGVLIDLAVIEDWIKSATQSAIQRVHLHGTQPIAASSNALSSVATCCIDNTIPSEGLSRPSDPCGQSDVSSPDPIIILETAGAVFSPLGPTLTNFDLASSVSDSLWLLVAPDRLGTLHDLAATLFMMKQRGRQPDFIVLSQPDPTDPSLNTNASELASLGIAAVCATVPHRDEAPQHLTQLLLQAIDERRSAAKSVG